MSNVKLLPEWRTQSSYNVGLMEAGPFERDEALAETMKAKPKP